MFFEPRELYENIVEILKHVNFEWNCMLFEPRELLCCYMKIELKSLKPLIFKGIACFSSLANYVNIWLNFVKILIFIVIACVSSLGDYEKHR